MRFNVMLVDPPGYRYGMFLYDTVRYLVHGLESLGHDVVVGRSMLEPSRINLVLNAHALATAEDVAPLLTSRAPVVIYQSEVIRDGQINLQDDSRYRDVYLPLLKSAHAVWDWSEDNVRLLGEQGVAASWVRMGYHPAMEEIRHKREKDIDFLFYGSVTPHRADILTALAERGHRVHVEFDCPALYRNDLIARSRIVLTLRQSGAMHQLPYFRINYLVNNHTLVAGERGLDGQWMEDAFLACPHDDTVGFLEECLARADHPGLVERHVAALKARPMTGFLAPAISAM
jgi:hypothetical protein